MNGKRFDVNMWVPEIPGGRRDRRRRGAGQEEEAQLRSGGGAGVASGSVEAPMQGTIVKVLVEVGQPVEVGAGIVVLEAMKMENQINAEKAGTVKEIKVTAGDTVGGGDVLAIIE